MPYDGNGTFVPVSAPDFPAVPDTLIRAAQFNAVINDLVQGLSEARVRDGRGGATANLPMNNNKHTGAAPANASGQYLVYGQSAASVADLTLSAGDPTADGQAARKAYVDRAGPPGMVAMFARNTPPPGWLEANGAAVSRTTYAALFAAIGTTWGAGDGVNTFNLPDLRGEFLRGWDNGRGVDTSRAFASAQGSANLSHDHGGTGSAGSHSHGGASGSNGSHSHTVTINNAGSHTHSQEVGPGDTGGNNRVLIGPTTGGQTFNNINGVGDHSHSNSVSTASAHTHPISTDGAHTHSIAASGGTEARPRNIALLVCVKI